MINFPSYGRLWKSAVFIFLTIKCLSVPNATMGIRPSNDSQTCDLLIATEQKLEVEERVCIYLRTERRSYSWRLEREEEIVHGETEEAGKDHIISKDKSLNFSSVKTDGTPVGQQIRTDIFKGLLITG